MIPKPRKAVEMEPEDWDQVPRLAAFRAANPGVIIKPPTRPRPRWHAVWALPDGDKGESKQTELRVLLDLLEARFGAPEAKK